MGENSGCLNTIFPPCRIISGDGSYAMLEGADTRNHVATPTQRAVRAVVLSFISVLLPAHR